MLIGIAARLELAKRVKNLSVSVDQFLFCLVTLGGAMPDETASAAAWAGEQQGKAMGKLFRPIIDALASLFGDSNHCYKSFLSEKAGTQLPSSYKELN